MLTKVYINDVLNCSKTLERIFKQHEVLPVRLTFKLYNLIKTFDSVSDYVIQMLQMTFPDINFEEEFTEEQKTFYNYLLSSEIELDIEKIDKRLLEESGGLLLSLADVENLSIILDKNNL